MLLRNGYIISRLLSSSICADVSDIENMSESKELLGDPVGDMKGDSGDCRSGLFDINSTLSKFSLRGPACGRILQTSIFVTR